ncbi:hypothetical protein [Sansalvadorimonas verongulae]|uniref:hypothetical protein n=1 Tax=Sansalvadorimonas verongulae TaxID=2172824 RepID=UPI0012BBD72D|nr:hypothetical protein [Sansalvadorimonas verongulae]
MPCQVWYEGRAATDARHATLFEAVDGHGKEHLASNMACLMLLACPVFNKAW